MEDKGRGGNGTLRTAGGGGNRAPPEMRFSVEGGNRAHLRSSDGGGDGATRMMDEFGGVNEGIKISTPPRRGIFINPYAKHSRPGGVRKGGSEIGHSGSRKGAKSSGNGVKSKGSGAKFESKNNFPRKTVRGSLVHTFVISGILADVGREEVK